MCEVHPTDVCGMDSEHGKLIILGQTELSGAARKRKSHQSALRALAFKWIRIIYHCWKTITRYDEAKYLLALE